MSTTIGFGYSFQNEDAFYSFKSLAEKFGYGVLKGIEYSESDVRSGLEVAQRNEGWDQLILLQSPVDGMIGLAFGIDEELTEFELGGIRPRFFDFLDELSRVAQSECKKLGVFFASEWYESDRVRYSYGNIEDLESLLSMPGSWGLRYMVPETGRLQDSDEIPLIFDLCFK